MLHPPTHSPTEGAKMWTELKVDTNRKVRVQKYHEGTVGMIGAAFRQVVHGSHSNFRIICIEPPHYVLAYAETEAQIEDLWKSFLETHGDSAAVEVYISREVVVHGAESVTVDTLGRLIVLNSTVITHSSNAQLVDYYVELRSKGTDTMISKFLLPQIMWQLVNRLRLLVEHAVGSSASNATTGCTQSSGVECCNEGNAEAHSSTSCQEHPSDAVTSTNVHDTTPSTADKLSRVLQYISGAMHDGSLTDNEKQAVKLLLAIIPDGNASAAAEAMEHIRFETALRLMFTTLA